MKRIINTFKTLVLQGIEPNGGGALSSNYVSKLGSKEEVTQLFPRPSE